MSRNTGIFKYHEDFWVEKLKTSIFKNQNVRNMWYL